MSESSQSFVTECFRIHAPEFIFYPLIFLNKKNIQKAYRISSVRLNCSESYDKLFSHIKISILMCASKSMLELLFEKTDVNMN